MRLSFEPRDRRRHFSRRAAITLAGQAALFGALGGRFFQLQVLQAEQYKLLAEENRLNLHSLMPKRGLIYDKNGVILAQNHASYTLELTSETVAQFDDGIAQLAQLDVFDSQEIQRIRALRSDFRSNLPMLLKTNLIWEQVSMIEYNADRLPGVLINERNYRYYPLGKMTAHMIGYTGPPTQQQIEENQLLRHPLFEVGKIGVERGADPSLRGKFGTQQVEVNARGRIIRRLETDSAVAGTSLHLPIDSRLQQYAYAQLRQYRRGAVVVADAATSAIRAMVSYPSFDPNIFRDGITSSAWQALVDHPDFPLENRAIRGLYPPGSTFKLCVAQAALRKGISPHKTFVCSGRLKFADRTYHCWQKYGHGRVDMYASLRESCDVYFYELAQLVGIDLIAREAKALGLGRQLQWDLQENLSGIIPTREWKKKRYDQSWLIGETLITAIGQGYCLTTPLELLTMLLRMLSVNGNTRQPWLWRAPEVINDPSVVVETLSPNWEINQNWRRVLFQSMQQVVNHPRGTAYRTRLEGDRASFAGKTGTSQVRSISQREREQDLDIDKDSPFHLRDHGLFVGFAPSRKPRFVIATVLEHVGSGAIAALLSREILNEAIRLERRA